MPTWAQLQADVYTWTNKPNLVAETTLALKSAIRTVHKSGKFWRDLAKTTVPGLALDPLQQINLVDIGARIRQIAYVKSAVQDLFMDPILVDDQLDADRIMRQNVYYGFGSSICIRAASPEDSYEIAYYQYPDMAFVTGGSSTDWIYDEFQELVVLWAASTVLATMGEQEIKSRVDQLAMVMFADLKSDNLEVVGR